MSSLFHRHAGTWLSACLSGLFAVAVHAAPFGAVSVFAPVPTPSGFPEGIAVQGNRVYVAGPATFGTSLNNTPSRVIEYDLATGAITRTLLTQGEQVFGKEHANSGVLFDGSGRMYVLNTQLGTLRVDLGTETQTVYAPPLPNHPPCLLGLVKPPCTPTPLNLPPLPNDAVFDDAGNLYVTDSFQATIWRIPPGGGTPQVWFRDARLASPYIGVNGLRISPDRSAMYFTVTTDLFGLGRLYRLPLVHAPSAASLQLVRTFGLGEGPDGFAFGASNQLYVTLALPGKSGVVVLDASGNELARVMNPLLSPIKPFDSPANVAFDGQGSLLVTNHAFATGLLLPKQFKVLRVFVGDTASPLAAPIVP